MWNSFVFNEKFYLIRFDEVSLDFLLYNIEHLFIAHYDRQELICAFKEKNPLFSIADNEEENFIKQVGELVMNTKDDEVNIVQSNDSITLSVNSEVSSRSIVLELAFKKANESQLQQNIIVSMIETIQYIELREKKFRKLLEDCDDEKLSNNYLECQQKLEVPTHNLFLSTFTKPQFLNTFSQNSSQSHHIVKELKGLTTRKRKLKAYKCD